MEIAQIHQLFVTEQLIINTDSRKKIPNSIFFALKGENFDGNKYAQKAIETGASYAVIDDENYYDEDNKQLILVNNVLETLQNLAKHHREQFNIPVIGLTGSNGKTTTKELINAVLKEKYNTIATIGNLNNHIGVPLTLLRIKPQTEIAIIEMGANHPKEIEFLCNIAQPVFGYITNFGKAHLEGFGSLEGVIKAKTELYTFIDNNDGMKFINGYDPKQLELTKQNNTITFCDEKCAITITQTTSKPYVEASFNNITVQSNLIGDYNFNNIAAAIAIGHYFKVPANAIKRGIENYTPTNNRSQLITKGTNSIILDAYNANPTSTTAAINTFSELTDRNKIVILGDMFELGKSAAIEHQTIADLLKEKEFQQVYLIGENYAKVKSNYPLFNSFSLFKEYLEQNKFSNATILIKGSRGMQLERILDLI